MSVRWPEWTSRTAGANPCIVLLTSDYGPDDGAQTHDDHVVDVALFDLILFEELIGDRVLQSGGNSGRKTEHYRHPQ